MIKKVFENVTEAQVYLGLDTEVSSGDARRVSGVLGSRMVAQLGEWL